MNNKLNRNVQKVLAGKRISLPESYAKKYGINEGDFVIVEASGSKLQVVPAQVTEKQV